MIQNYFSQLGDKHLIRRMGIIHGMSIQTIKGTKNYVSIDYIKVKSKPIQSFSNYYKFMQCGYNCCVIVYTNRIIDAMYSHGFRPKFIV